MNYFTISRRFVRNILLVVLYCLALIIGNNTSDESIKWMCFMIAVPCGAWAYYDSIKNS